MKRTLIAFSLLIGIGLLQMSCSKNFDDINTDPNKATESSFDPQLLLPSSQFTYANSTYGYNSGILFQSMWVQILASTSTGGANYYSNGDKYRISSNTNSYVQSIWREAYKAASYAYEMERQTKNNPLYPNVSKIAVIMQIQSIATISDVYGNVPYSQALKAKEGFFTPKYDSQETLYKSMLSKLDSVVSKLDIAGEKPAYDAFPYEGDIAKWKKYGYSLMLKLAMRLVKADPATAKTYAEKAVAGGVFTSVEDDAYVKGDNPNGYNNGNADAFNVTADLYEVRWSKTFIDYLKATDDIRLSKVSEVPANGLHANQRNADGNSDPAIQFGLPNGYDLNGGATDLTKRADYPGSTPAVITPKDTTDQPAVLGKYSRPTPVYSDRSGPLFVLTYAEVALLLAEAAERGYSVGGTAADFYKKGVSAGIQSLAKFGTAATITASAADAYADAHPLNSGTALQQINEQYWVVNGTLMNFVEAWSNWRRSGYPVLVPVNYTGNFSNSTIPRREPYPSNEATQNPQSYQDAVKSLTGGDTWTTRVWWDQ
ncbi:SusD/RagB family nutrient-binding outer membrane lipoprotein [Cytophagaceae bacterium YF14B1]|uniref:SusD/RagB family nutrient-binding outer membrane lipoprotein n=1 Tax=Xanthocytophaga flava TaxID=3048013 RepID=A0AAE3UBF4_9BACT|nr:SusD/RagB family nutrient-binding outer membrane lipoprotein [Xanthocytophaga flavus]MDJ1483724.1 SusD/RagB family nutrient-binding outer membrane lipoprotein [Xanthocytophaga flavus]